jgi:sterol desaturase/sphingolipid hydroxylase (fatty acid hydroxylase superfamily)
MLNDNVLSTAPYLSNTFWSLESAGEAISFVLLACFAVLSALEARFSKIKQSASTIRQSYRTNLALFLFNSVLLSMCSVSSLYLVAERYSHLGLLNEFSSSGMKAILAFLACDLLLYCWHRTCHLVEPFWLFHRVHHCDPHLNVSTAFRLHFVEVLLTNIFKALLIVGMGVDKSMVLVFEACTAFFIMFHHANISFQFERLLGYAFIVPRLHRVPHSTERCEHDNNFGAVFSFWDRLFGTFLEGEPKKIGINGDSPQDLFNLIKFGLGLYMPRPVWAENLDGMIAEAAYYKAEKRNFNPGNELRDWLEAKADILGQGYSNMGRKKYAQLHGWQKILNHQ